MARHCVRPASKSVRPPALRASGCGPTSTQAVSLPSIVRCTRNQVVQRETAQRGKRRVGEIERHHAKATGLQDEIERFQRAFDDAIDQGPRAPRPRDVMPTDLQQPIEVYPRGHDRRQVKTIEGINERRNLAATRGRGKCLQQQRGPSRRSRSGEFRQLPARKSAAHPRAPAAHACAVGGKTRHRARERRRATRLSPFPGGIAVVSVRSSLRARSASSRTANTRFAIYSP